LIECDTLLLLNKMLAASGGRADVATLASGLPAALDGFASSATADGRVHHVGSRRDGVDAVRPWAFSRGCTCINYVGPLHLLKS
jgi:hypothetical protein